ncbi:MAG TPA: hypothetical protein VIQ30_07820 [Pseudonocardia sp.]|jgi:hypothetical protein
MSNTKGRALRVTAVAVGALALGAVFGGTAVASPLGGLGGNDDSDSGYGNSGYGSGFGDFANGEHGYDDRGYNDNGYRSAFGEQGTPGMHNDLFSFDVPDVETK